MGEGKELGRPDLLDEGTADLLFTSIGTKMMHEFRAEVGGVRRGGKRG